MILGCVILSELDVNKVPGLQLQQGTPISLSNWLYHKDVNAESLGNNKHCYLERLLRFSTTPVDYNSSSACREENLRAICAMFTKL